jgi:hypothetical protein
VQYSSASARYSKQTVTAVDGPSTLRQTTSRHRNSISFSALITRRGAGSSEHGHMLFCWGENGNLRAWRLASNGVATYIACSAEVAAVQSREPFGGMPGGMMCLSGDSMTPNTAVLWACIPYLACEERVDFMAVTAQSCPDFRTVSEFRKRHLKAL